MAAPRKRYNHPKGKKNVPRDRYINWDLIRTQYVQGIVSIAPNGTTIREYPSAAELSRMHEIPNPSTIIQKRYTDRKRGKDWDEAREKFRARLDEELLVPEDIRSQKREQLDLRTAWLVERKMDLLEKGLEDEEKLVEEVAKVEGLRGYLDGYLKAVTVQQKTTSTLSQLHQTYKSALEQRPTVNASGTAASDEQPKDLAELERRMAEFREREKARLAGIEESINAKRAEESIALTSRNKRQSKT